jgi:hypothetical protein
LLCFVRRYYVSLKCGCRIQIYNFYGSNVFQVENHVVGAPCGVMDQMASACGEANKLLAMVCQVSGVISSGLQKLIDHTFLQSKKKNNVTSVFYLISSPAACRSEGIG